MLCKWPSSRCSSCTDGAAFSMSATTPALKCSCGANINMLVNLKVMSEKCKKMLSSKAQEPTIALPIVVRLLFIKHFMSDQQTYVLSSLVRYTFIKKYLCYWHQNGNVFVLRSSYVKNSTRRWVTLSQSVRRETNFSKNRIWPQPTRYVFILEISAKKVPKYFLPQICLKQTFAAVQRVSGQPWKTPDATLPGHCQDPAKCIITSFKWFVDFQDIS